MVLMPALYRFILTGAVDKLWQLGIVPVGLNKLLQEASFDNVQPKVPGSFCIAIILRPTEPNGPRERTLNQLVTVLKALGTTNEVVVDVPVQPPGNVHV